MKEEDREIEEAEMQIVKNKSEKRRDEEEKERGKQV